MTGLTYERLERIRGEYDRWAKDLEIGYTHGRRAGQADLLARMVPELLAEIVRLRTIVLLREGQPDADCQTCKHATLYDGALICECMGDPCEDATPGCAWWEAKC